VHKESSNVDTTRVSVRNPRSSCRKMGSRIPGGPVYLSQEYVAELDSHGDEHQRTLVEMATPKYFTNTCFVIHSRGHDFFRRVFHALPEQSHLEITSATKCKTQLALLTSRAQLKVSILVEMTVIPKDHLTHKCRYARCSLGRSEGTIFARVTKTEGAGE
jgi:hypothetical protein